MALSLKNIWNLTPLGFRPPGAFPLCESGHVIPRSTALWRNLTFKDPPIASWLELSPAPCPPAVLQHGLSFSLSDPHPLLCPAHQPSPGLPFPVPYCFAAVTSLPGWDLGSRSWIHLPGRVWAFAQAQEKERTGVRWPATCYLWCHVLLVSQVTWNTKAKLLCHKQIWRSHHLRVCII